MFHVKAFGLSVAFRTLCTFAHRAEHWVLSSWLKGTGTWKRPPWLHTDPSVQFIIWRHSTVTLINGHTLTCSLTGRSFPASQPITVNAVHVLHLEVPRLVSLCSLSCDCSTICDWFLCLYLVSLFSQCCPLLLRLCSYPALVLSIPPLCFPASFVSSCFIYFFNHFLSHCTMQFNVCVWIRVHFPCLPSQWPRLHGSKDPMYSQINSSIRFKTSHVTTLFTQL